IRHNTTTHPDKKSLPVGAHADQLLDHRIHSRLLLIRFSRRDDDRIPAFEFLLMPLKDILVRKDHRLLLVHQLLQISKVGIEIISSGLAGKFILQSVHICSLSLTNASSSASRFFTL